MTVTTCDKCGSDKSTAVTSIELTCEDDNIYPMIPPFDLCVNCQKALRKTLTAFLAGKVKP